MKMKNTQDIENYLAGNLTGQDLVAFENALKTDGNLRKEIADIREFEERMEGLRIRNHVKQVLTKPRTGLRVALDPSIWAVAASFALLIAAGFWYLHNQKIAQDALAAQRSQEELKQKTINEDDILYGSPNERAENNLISAALESENLDNNALLKQAFKDLKDKKTTEAEALFTRFVTENPSAHDEVAYFRALSILMTDASEGTILLQNIANKQDNKRQEQARKLLLDISKSK